MKKTILVLYLFSVFVFADQKLENIIETVKVEGDVFGYPATTKIDIFGELEKRGYNTKGKKLFYLLSEHNKVATVKLSSSGHSYDAKSKSENIGYVFRNKLNIQFTPRGQAVDENDWYSLDYNKRLQIYISDGVSGSGQIVTFIPQKIAKGNPIDIRSKSTADLQAVEKNLLIKIVENNAEIEEPVVDKKTGFFDQLKRKIKSNQ